MFLKSLEIFGFKSFADRTHIDFADGITSLLGPNGCGKSNIVDSIKWVLGEQSIKSLRAGKREDVIFNGTDHRKPSQMAEVTLVINNEERFINLDFPEIEIKRRLFRDGESEYYINRQKALLKNVKDLFLDTGVGKTAYSILEQGKIDQILSSKPEERRVVFEEAAGISRFKAQCTDAQKKIEKTEENIEQVNNILKEVKRTYDSRKSQMAKFLEYKEVAKKKEETEVELQLSNLQSYVKVQALRKSQLAEAEEKLESLTESLRSIQSDASEQEREISRIREQKTEIQMDISRLDESVKGKKTNLEIYDKHYWESRQKKLDAETQAEKYKATLDTQNVEFDQVQEKIDASSSRIVELENKIIEINDSIAAAQDDIENCKVEIGQRQEEINTLSQDRLVITHDISELAARIVEELQILIDDSGYSVVMRKQTEKSVLENLARMSRTLKENGRTVLSLFLSNPEQYKGQLLDLYQNLSDTIDEIKGLFQEYCGTIPTFIDELLQPEGIIAQKKNLDRKLNSNQKMQEEMTGNIGFLTQKLEHHRMQIEDLRNEAAEKNSDLSSEKATRNGLLNLMDQMKTNLQMKQNQYEEALERIGIEENNVNENLENLNRVKGEIEDTKALIAERRNDLSDINLQLEAETLKLKEKNGSGTQILEESNQCRNKISSLNSDIINLGEMLDKIYADFFDQYGKSLKEFDNHEVTADVEEMRNQLNQLKQKINSIGYVNQMAEDEFNEVKTRFDFLTGNLADLEKGKADLQEVYQQIRTQSEDLFNETFSKISQEFKSMFTRIFAGGRAELNLVDPENPLESGIEILAQPPGKKLTYLPLLSGGERSMTAVALLFATYAVKPSPFCILDEIDAALDARNIGYFLSVLDDFNEKSQFIIITHNKNTVMGSRTLLGVTQQEQGVSSMISYKLENQKNLDGLSLK